MQVKISGNIFECSNSNIQLSLGSHATVELTFDMNTCKCYEYFLKISDLKSQFCIESKSFIASGCKIKSLDINYGRSKMNISIHCDLLDPVDVEIRREDTLNEILSKTFSEEDDIK